MDDDWDLHAVVRGCATSTTTATISSTTTVAATTISTSTSDPCPSFSSLPFLEDQNSFDFPGLIDDRNENPFQGLQEIYQEFCVDPSPPPAAAAAATISTPTGQVLQPHQEILQIQPPVLHMNMQNQESIQFMNPRLSSSSHNFPAINPQPIRPRRRKNQQMKMVREMTQEELSADSWAWRKYGQKPIKGSPYPRNYYRCSTSKGCAARKQVERSPNDPGIFVVSYTGEHTHPRPAHRSSLAGSTRTKFSSSPAASAAAANAKSDNNINKALLLKKGTSFSPTTPLVEGEAEAQNNDVEMAEEEDGGAGDDDEENMIMLTNEDEELFKGFQDSDHSSGGGDLFPSGLLSSPPWTPTSSGANAAGGGG